jgi:SAM-dependent methyltransferase
MGDPQQHDLNHHHHRHAHRHQHVELDEAEWAAWADQTEIEGELHLSFITDTATWVSELRGLDAPPVERVIDVGSGPGVGTCELARCFPHAQVIAVDSSPAMLERATGRIAAQGLETRIGTRLAELPDGLDRVERADVMWASMVLHHLGDEVSSLRQFGAMLRPHGLLAIAEFGDPTRVLPDDLGFGRPGLEDRLDAVTSTWFAAMRASLPDSVGSTDLHSMLDAAGFDVIGSRLARSHHDAPLSDQARRVVVGHLGRMRHLVGEGLDEDDVRTLEILCDVDDPRGVMHRSDVFVRASRQIVIARPKV